MRKKMLLLVAAMSGLALGDAAAQYDGTRDCENFANAFYKRHDAGFKRFTIDKDTVSEIAFDDAVGSQHVTAIFRGRGKYTDADRTATGTFVCLHGGAGAGALFIHLIPRARGE